MIEKESRNASFTAVTEEVKKKARKLIDAYAAKLLLSSSSVPSASTPTSQ